MTDTIFIAVKVTTYGDFQLASRDKEEVLDWLRRSCDVPDSIPSDTPEFWTHVESHDEGHTKSVSFLALDGINLRMAHYL